MKVTTLLIVPMTFLLTVSCGPLQPVSTTVNGSLKDYKYIYVSETNSLTSSSGFSIDGQYYSTSKSVNPQDVITGILAKEGYVFVPEIKDEIEGETLVVNFGESGRRNRGLGYTIEVTIQFVDAGSSSMICSCTAEGQGDTEADDIRLAIIRCLEGLQSS